MYTQRNPTSPTIFSIDENKAYFEGYKKPIPTRNKAFSLPEIQKHQVEPRERNNNAKNAAPRDIEQEFREFLWNAITHPGDTCLGSAGAWYSATAALTATSNFHAIVSAYLVIVAGVLGLKGGLGAAQVIREVVKVGCSLTLKTYNYLSNAISSQVRLMQQQGMRYFSEIINYPAKQASSMLSGLYATFFGSINSVANKTIVKNCVEALTSKKLS